MGIKLSNNANATLAAGINSSATSITVTSGQGARFPTLTAGDYFYATLVDTSNNLEIVKCTARSTDVLTVVRAQESTTARAYSTGDRIEIRITAATFVDATTINVTASKVLGRDTSGSGVVQELPIAVTSGGDVGIGTTTPQCKFEVAGLVRATSLTNPSSGSGVEVGYDGTQGVIQAFSNRATNTAVPINIQGDLKMNSGYGSSVLAYGCRAWAKFGGISNSIVASGNFSSITDRGTGLYKANFTNNLVDANYAVVTAAQPNGYSGAVLGAGGSNAAGDSNTNTYVALECRNYLNSNNEPNELFLAVFR
jgi:hypothetical protein